MDIILALCLGIGLSAACGFRVFVPLFIMSGASLIGLFTPAEGFEWLALPAVCFGLAIATLSEISAYYVPWIDNALDTIATPAALLAGTITTMAVISGEMSQFAAWSSAIIVGGGTASAVQVSTVVARGLSTSTTGGLGNFVISTLEWMSALLVSILALFLPVMMVIILAIMAFFIVRWVVERKKILKRANG